ncbi:hypothetical protein A3K73_00465 [Candidatus Pacearchaeota archaeon RBG_13_36_9]|nr:MAG: hypothetical protein A3K73_00465 [Candidatus Pacearchaeota archaeon RBG_13_36_9]
MDKNKIKLVLDILMFLAAVVIFYSGFALWGKLPLVFQSWNWIGIHQWISVLLLVLLVIHWIFNFAWIKSWFRKSEPAEPVEVPLV